MQPLPRDFHHTRTTLHRVAAHVLGRRRYEVTNRFGLRVTPGGFGTPAFGGDLEVLRVSGTELVHEGGDATQSLSMTGATLCALAAFAGTSLFEGFSVGAETPEVGDAGERLRIDERACDVVARWFGLGLRALDRVSAALPQAAAPGLAQVWPEHFDLGTHVGLANGERLNLGVSPGDGFCPEPYAYVGPRGEERRGDSAYWNAPFGAILRRSETSTADGPDDVGEATDAVVRFMRTGIANAGEPAVRD